MEYERIHKVQTGIISPSKLRMRLMGSHHNRKKDGSNNNSSRTSPARLEDAEFAKNSLLGTNEEEALTFEKVPFGVPTETTADGSLDNHNSGLPKESILKNNNKVNHVKLQPLSRGEGGNSSAVHPMRTTEDENLDYDSNASSSSFEFHKEERLTHNPILRPFSRPMSSKWNDAEKWIMNKQIVRANHSKKNVLHNQANRIPITNMGRIVPESVNHDHSLQVNHVAETKQVDISQSMAQIAFQKLSFVPEGTPPILGQIDQLPQSKDLREVSQGEVTSSKTSTEDTTVAPAIRSVCMRDMGTEMTPVTSQEPSRTATPMSATSPLRSPSSSIPSTPRRQASGPTRMDRIDSELQPAADTGNTELSEQELKVKTRREIVALGVQLGKMNIANWASKDDAQNSTSVETTNLEELEQIEYEKRAAAWEEAEKSKHAARYKREEIKIQSWESQQRAKLEAEMQKIEAKVEQIKAQAQAKMLKKTAMSRQRSEEKRAAVEARKQLDAEKTAREVEYIRQTGKLPSSHYMCCGWFS